MIRLRFRATPPRRQAMTLIELLIVVAIVAIMMSAFASAVIPVMRGHAEMTLHQRMQSDLAFAFDAMGRDTAISPECVILRPEAESAIAPTSATLALLLNIPAPEPETDEHGASQWVIYYTGDSRLRRVILDGAEVNEYLKQLELGESPETGVPGAGVTMIENLAAFYVMAPSDGGPLIRVEAQAAQEKYRRNFQARISTAWALAPGAKIREIPVREKRP